MGRGLPATATVVDGDRTTATVGGVMTPASISTMKWEMTIEIRSLARATHVAAEQIAGRIGRVTLPRRGFLIVFLFRAGFDETRRHFHDRAAFRDAVRTASGGRSIVVVHSQ